MPKRIETARKLFSLPPLWRRRLSILGLILASLLTLYTLAGFFLAPYLLTRYVPRYVSEQLHLQLRLDQVRINPLLFTCEVKGIAVHSPEEDEPLLSVQRLFLDFELESLSRWAWIFADLAIERPTLHLAFDADGRLNLEKLAAGLPQSEAPPAAEKKPLPRLLLKHLALSGGTVRMADHSTHGPVKTTITPIALESHTISTLPEHCGTYAVSASFPDGGALGWKGEMSLEPLSATGAIELKNFKPAAFWRLFQDRLNLAEPGGTVQLTASYQFAMQNNEPALRVNPLSLTVSNLALAKKGADQPLLKLESLTADGGQIDFLTRQMLFPVIILKGGQLAALVNEAGVGNWQGLVKEPPQSPATKAPRSKAKAAAHEPPPWRIAIKSFAASDLGLHYSDVSSETLISVEANLNMALTEGKIDLGKQDASLQRIALAGGGLTVTQSPALPGKAAEHKKDRPGAKRETTLAQTAPPPQKNWKLALNRFSVSGFHLGFVDQKRKPPLAYDLNDLRAEVKDFALPAEKPVSFEIQSGIRQGGSARMNGTVSHANGRLGLIEAQISVARLNLKPLQSLVTEHAALTLVSGDLSANTHLRYAMDEPQPSLTVAGEATIGKLLLNEEQTGARLLAWKELAASGLDFGLNPDRLTIKEIRLREPGVKITVFKDKSLNLAEILKQQPEEEDAEKPPFPVAVERVRLDNGVVDFADFSLVLPFATRIEQGKGAVTGISTKLASRATLKFEGRVGKFGQAKAEGSLAPANPKQFTDLKVAFRNVAMPPLSPYSATFAGRTIASGKLDLDLDYNIRNSELLGDNSVVLKDFTLGDRVESPSAMDLPLDLAIALLTDSEGKIDIAMPIRGNVDHPEFSYGHLIREALFNLLAKVVTAPFRALAALFGGRSENLDTILFEPGRADLAPPEQEKLKRLAEVLGKRKEFQLTVHGGFEPGLDSAALKSARVRRALAQKLGVKLEPDEDPGPVAYDNAKIQRALEGLAGTKLAAFQTGYEEIAGRKAKRVNPALALLGRASEDHAFYQALFDYLVETAPLTEAELQRLAEQRGKAIVQELTVQAAVDAGRIIAGPAVRSEGQDKAVPAKLELSLR